MNLSFLLPAFMVGLLAMNSSLAEAQDSAELSYRAKKDWQVELPKEQFKLIGDAFVIAGKRFVVEVQGSALWIDVDGDGQGDVKAEGESAFVTLQAPGAARYAVRLRRDDKGWSYAASGMMVGKLGKTTVQLIDQNGNGHYDEVGVDAMVVGRGKVAQFLSKVVSLDGQLLTLQVGPDGQQCSVQPFAGKRGFLNLHQKLITKAKLLKAVLLSENGEWSFEMGKYKKGLEIPAGNYSLYSGELGLGVNRVQFRSGRAKQIVVAADGHSNLAWGGPVVAEFRYDRVGSKVRIAPNNVWYYGSFGEEYYNWFPAGKSPEFTIKQKGVVEAIAVAKFPGST